MRYRFILAALAAAPLALDACASSTAGGGVPGPSTSLSDSRMPRWTASIQSIKEERINIAPDSLREKSFGTAQWTQGAAASQSNVNLTFSYSGPERDLSWAILFGPCGNASLPVVPLSNFPELNVGANGKGQVNGTIAVDVPPSGTFHIDIYKDRTGSIEALVACGNLRLSRG